MTRPNRNNLAGFFLAALVAATAGPAVSVTTEAQQTQTTTPTIDFKPELTIQLEVASLDRSIAFYTKTLGFTLTERRDDLKFAHIATSVPGVDIGIGEAASPQPKGFVLNFSVTDADAARRTLEAAGVVFTGPTVVIPGKVKLAGFADPDGNRLRFAGPAPR